MNVWLVTTYNALWWLRFQHMYLFWSFDKLVTPTHILWLDKTVTQNVYNVLKIMSWEAIMREIKWVYEPTLESDCLAQRQLYHLWTVRSWANSLIPPTNIYGASTSCRHWSRCWGSTENKVATPLSLHVPIWEVGAVRAPTARACGRERADVTVKPSEPPLQRCRSLMNMRRSCRCAIVVLN